MNRPGQPQQRQPSIAPNPGLTNQFRHQYTNYGPPPRNVNVLQPGGFVPGLQPNNPRPSSQQAQAQGMLHQLTPNYIQQRAQGSFPFGGGLGQHQSTTALQQQQQQQSQPPQQQPPSQQTNGASNPLPPHLTPGSSLGAPSANDIGLGPNDFPALGSTPITSNATVASGGNAGGASYASQAGTGIPLSASGAGAGTLGGGASGAAGTGQTREFTADDFPALGGGSGGGNGSSSSQQQSQTGASQDSHPHPPGLNGFQQHSDHTQSHRPTLPGAQQSTPGMLNIGAAQARNIHPGFQQGQADGDKQQQLRSNFSLKLNQTGIHAWGAPSTPSANNQHNGTHPGQNSTPHLNAPPGVPPPTYPNQAQQPPQQQQPSGVGANNGTGAYPSTNGLPATPAAPAAGTTADANSANSSANVNSQPGQQQQSSNPAAGGGAGTAPGTSQTPHPPAPPMSNNVSSASSGAQQQQSQHPQTPAQQILISAADRWGLLGLLAMIKNAGSDPDQGLSSVGTDLGTLGLDMTFAGNLYSSLVAPWTESAAGGVGEPDFQLPACYASVQPPLPGPSKAAGFSDDTLFYMFYAQPRDALQELAAQELWNRNWRFHKELRLWITKESGTPPSQKVQGGEQGTYTYFDTERWTKERKELTVLYADLEEKNQPAFAPGPGLVNASHAQAQAVQAQVQAQAQAAVAAVNAAAMGGQQGSLPPTQRGSFQMGVAGL